MSVAQALATGDLTRLPSRRDEDWRWSDLRGLIRVAPPASPVWTGETVPGPFAGLGDEVLVINGRGPASLSLAAGESRTVALRLIAAANAGAHACRLSIDLAAGARLTLLESHEAVAGEYLSSTELDITLAQGARLERLVLACEQPLGVAVTIAEVRLAEGAIFEQTCLTQGGRRERLETRVRHPGHGASVRLDGLYLLSGRRHGDQTTLVTHEGVNGSTQQLTKGFAAGQARGVFQGRIVVEHGADKTDARMRHQALILSDQAEVDAKPELEIFADDVACAHGNTVGALDEDAMFYARQRGLSEPQARALLMQAFLGEVVDRIGHDGAREVAARFVAVHLDALA